MCKQLGALANHVHVQGNVLQQLKRVRHLATSFGGCVIYEGASLVIVVPRGLPL